MAYTTINKSGDYFNTITYTGDDVDGRTITGVGFQPDFSWVKARSSAFSHYLIDALRYDSGASKYLKLDSSSNSADETPSGAGWISTLNSDGYVCKNGTSNTNNCNENGVTYASWNWKANGAGSANTDGSINSTVSANTTAGFSIVSYTGSGSNATVGHGLGSTPKMFIIKDRDAAKDWTVYHNSIGATKFIEINTNLASQTNSTAFNDTAPTNQIFNIGDGGTVNTSGNDYIAYCFAEKTGYSKFGSYTGNGNADGTFVYTGFKPAFVISKNTSITQHWSMNDTKRDPFNVGSKRLWPSQSNAEVTNSAYYIDYLSNGFKIRSNSSSWNGSGNTMIYMAFAEAPLVGTNNIPATAR